MSYCHLFSPYYNAFEPPIYGSLWLVSPDGTYIYMNKQAVSQELFVCEKSLDVVGNASISGDLAVNDNALYVDSVNKRVGIGTEPSTPLHIYQSNTEYENFYCLALETGTFTDNRWYKIVQYTLGTDGNGCLNLKGIFSGHTQTQGRSIINLVFHFRDGLTQLGTVVGNPETQDIVIYQDSTDTNVYTFYFKLSKWAQINVDLSIACDDVDGFVYVYDETYVTTEPSGTHVFSLLTDTGTNILRLDQNGCVGINTTSPSETLEVVGNASISGDVRVDTNTLYVDSTNDRIGINTDTPLTFLHISDTESDNESCIGIMIDYGPDADFSYRWYKLAYVFDSGSDDDIGCVNLRGIISGRTTTGGRSVVNLSFHFRQELNQFGIIMGYLNLPDIVIYQEGDDHYIYLKLYKFTTVNLNMYIATANDRISAIYDGTYVNEEPSGTQVFSLLTDTGTNILRLGDHGCVGVNTVNASESLEVVGNASISGSLISNGMDIVTYLDELESRIAALESV